VYCDALTLAAVVDELRHKLLGGRIQDVLAVDQWSIGLEVYANRQRQYLLLSAQPEEGGRLHLVPHKLRRGLAAATPLLLRLRKRAKGAHCAGITQPPHERLVQFVLEGPESPISLVVETMGRLSNILLLEADGTILECVKHVPATQNRYRVLLPGRPYVPPPPQQKPSVGSLTPGHLAKLLEKEPGVAVWRGLVAAVRGVSPLLAREVAFRATGDSEAVTADAGDLLLRLQELLRLPESGQWQPSIAFDKGAAIAYAPYPLTQYQQRESRDSISQAMIDFHTQRIGTDAYAVLRKRVQDRIEAARQRQLRKQEALLRAQPGRGLLDELRTKGEWLLAYAHEVSPGQSELVVHPGEAEAPVHIALDSFKSPIENAQEYFRRYEKAKSAAAEVPALLAAVDVELAYLDQLSTDLALAEDQPGIAAVEAALAQGGYLTRPKVVRRPAAGPLRLVSDDGLTIWVGRNSWQNEEVTFGLCAADDIWLHAQGVPGAHVVIRTEGRNVPQDTLQQAAELAARFSAARHNATVAVDYTIRRNVRRRKGGKPGQVLYREHKTLTVRPAKD